MADKNLFKWLLLLLILPIGLDVFGGDRFRYPCQDPNNWEKDICKRPLCDVTRTCIDHVFKGQRDPRLGPDQNAQTQTTNNFNPAQGVGFNSQGANCGK